MPKIDKDLNISLLLDFYGAMLTDIQKQAVDYYYNQDFSLAEIAELKGISRQGVRDSIKRAEKQLLEYEEKLGLFARFHEIQEKLNDIDILIESIGKENQYLTNSTKINSDIVSILEITKTINQ